jgi:hypothetical protein
MVGSQYIMCQFFVNKVKRKFKEGKDEMFLLISFCSLILFVHCICL